MLLLVLSICLIGVYFIHVADSMEEYMYSFFLILIGICIIVSQTSLIFKNDELFHLIDFMEMVLNDSEFYFVIIYLTNKD